MNQLVEGCRKILVEVGDLLPDANVKDAYELLEHNEWGEALSLICTQLYEYDIHISKANYDLIEQIGRQMKMNHEEWKMLKELIM